MGLFRSVPKTLQVQNLRSPCNAAQARNSGYNPACTANPTPSWVWSMPVCPNVSTPNLYYALPPPSPAWSNTNLPFPWLDLAPGGQCTSLPLTCCLKYEERTLEKDPSSKGREFNKQSTTTKVDPHSQPPDLFQWWHS